MIPVRIREMTTCPQHRQAIIVLEDPSSGRTLTIAADPDEDGRLAREMSRGPEGTHPIYDFVDGLVEASAMMATCVVLDYSPGDGLGAAVRFRRSEAEVDVPCYVSDSLALAQRAGIPIYVSSEIFASISTAPAAHDPGELESWLAGLRPEDFTAGPASDGVAAD